MEKIKYEKVLEFSTEDLENFIETTREDPYCFPSRRIKVMYGSWVRNTDDKREFPQVYREKYEKHMKEIEGRITSFKSQKVGQVHFFTDDYYELHLLGEPLMKVTTPNVKESLRAFCNINFVEMRKVSANTSELWTIFKP